VHCVVRNKQLFELVFENSSRDEYKSNHTPTQTHEHRAAEGASGELVGFPALTLCVGCVSMCVLCVVRR